jgi:hypothetical protein
VPAVLTNNYKAVRDALVAVVESVTQIKSVQAYEPSSVQAIPLAWVLLDGYTRSVSFQIVSMNYRFVVRVASPLSGSIEAEDSLVQAAIEICDAVDRDPQFSRALYTGMAQSPDGATGWVIVGGAKCRVVDVFVQAHSEHPFGI